MKQNQQLPLSTLMVLSLAISPFLLTILLLKTWEKYLLELGKFSEEIFRAEQLPLLSFSDHSSLTQTASDKQLN